MQPRYAARRSRSTRVDDVGTSLSRPVACVPADVPYSPLGPTGTLWAVGVPILFFASAIAMYITHGILRDTDNQMQRPHVLGSGTVPAAMVGVYMTSLMVGEIGGFAILLWGFVRTVLVQP